MFQHVGILNNDFTAQSEGKRILTICQHLANYGKSIAALFFTPSSQRPGFYVQSVKEFCSKVLLHCANVLYIKFPSPLSDYE